MLSLRPDPDSNPPSEPLTASNMPPLVLPAGAPAVELCVARLPSRSYADSRSIVAA